MGGGGTGVVHTLAGDCTNRHNVICFSITMTVLISGIMCCCSMVAVDAGHDVCGSGTGIVRSAGGHHSPVL